MIKPAVIDLEELGAEWVGDAELEPAPGLQTIDIHIRITVPTGAGVTVDYGAEE